MKEHCENPRCENPGAREVPVSVREPADQARTLCAPCEEAYTWGVQQGTMSAMGRLAFSQVDRLISERGFIVLAMNRTDPSPDGAFEAWSYRGPLDFGLATPLCFGVGASPLAALRALDAQLPAGERTVSPARAFSPGPLFLSRRELAAILAGLRLLQAQYSPEAGERPNENAGADIQQIATDGGTVQPLSSTKIDELCERLNLGPERVHSALQRIHDLLYLDIQNGRELHSPGKACDADTLASIADIVAEYIPRPADPDGPEQ